MACLTIVYLMTALYKMKYTQFLVMLSSVGSLTQTRQFLRDELLKNIALISYTHILNLFSQIFLHRTDRLCQVFRYCSLLFTPDFFQLMLWSLGSCFDGEYRLSCPFLLDMHWRCPCCNCYHRRKWTRWHEFKSWTRLITFHIALIPLGKVWIQLFSLQLWVNSRTV